MSPTTTGVRLWFVLWRSWRTLADLAETNIDSLGLGYSDFAVLEALLHAGPAPVSVLGRKVLLTSGSITAAVDRLQGRGLVERRTADADRRSRIVHLTDAGRELITDAFAAHAAAMEEAAQGLDGEERRELVRLLLTLRRGALATRRQP